MADRVHYLTFTVGPVANWVQAEELAARAIGRYTMEATTGKNATPAGEVLRAAEFRCTRRDDGKWDVRVEVAV